MSQRKPMFLGLLAAGVWLLFPLILCVITPYATFVIPTSIMPKLQAQGINELPFGDQLLVDISDFCIHRWFVVFPLLFILAVGTTVQFLAALRASKREGISH